MTTELKALAEKFAKQVTQWPNELREWREVTFEKPSQAQVAAWFEKELKAALAASRPEVPPLTEEQMGLLKLWLDCFNDGGLVVNENRMEEWYTDNLVKPTNALLASQEAGKVPPRMDVQILLAAIERLESLDNEPELMLDDIRLVCGVARKFVVPPLSGQPSAEPRRRAWWCCNGDFGSHEEACPNYVAPASPAASPAPTDIPCLVGKGDADRLQTATRLEHSKGEGKK